MGAIYNYHQDDKPYAPFHFYDELLLIAIECGYESYTAALKGLYAKHKSYRKVGLIFNLSMQSIRAQLRKIGIKAASGPGGWNGYRRAPVIQKVCSTHGLCDHYVKEGGCCQCKSEYMKVMRESYKDSEKPLFSAGVRRSASNS